MIISASTKIIFEATGFRSEKELQDTIEKLPSLLNAISQLNRQDYPLFILKREFGVSSGSVDFLAVDVDGSLYVLETKLAENPELRRAVIGQVLEYASNLSDMPYDSISAECLKYLKKQGALEQVVRDFYVAQSDGEPVLTASEYRKVMTENLKGGRFNIVIIANKVSLEIQKLFHFVDQETKDSLNFIVLEINKYHLDSDEILHSGIVWAAKYIKSLFSRRQIDEETYLASLTPHVRELVKHIDEDLTSKGLDKTANTKGLSWKKPHVGSILVMGNVLDTNWPSKRRQPVELSKFMDGVLKKAVALGLIVTPQKRMKIELTDSVSVAKVEQYIELAMSVIQKVDELKS